MVIYETLGKKCPVVQMQVVNNYPLRKSPFFSRRKVAFWNTKWGKYKNNTLTLLDFGMDGLAAEGFTRPFPCDSHSFDSTVEEKTHVFHFYLVPKANVILGLLQVRIVPVVQMIVRTLKFWYFISTENWNHCSISFPLCSDCQHLMHCSWVLFSLLFLDSKICQIKEVQ